MTESNIASDSQPDRLRVGGAAAEQGSLVHYRTGHFGNTIGGMSSSPSAGAASDSRLPFVNPIQYCFASTQASRKDLSRGHPTFFSSRHEPADDTVLMWREQVSEKMLMKF